MYNYVLQIFVPYELWKVSHKLMKHLVWETKDDLPNSYYKRVTYTVGTHYPRVR